MDDTKRILIWAGTLLLALLSQSAHAQETNTDELYAAPKWAVDFKGGKFEPDIDNYDSFYDGKDTGFLGIGGSYRIKNWLELGMELGYSNDDGVGELSNAGTTGGNVEYTLLPLQVFLNLRYDVKPNQLFVPYAGVGIVTAWYKQEIDRQSNRDGRTDIGGSARLGLQLLLNGFDRRGASYVSGEKRLRTYLFVEAQTYSTKIDGIDLGGELYLVGLRLEFD
jgi:opacity protein-like surface antigen